MMNIVFDLLGEILTTALVTKKWIWFLLFFIVLCGIGGYLYLNY